VRHYSAVARKSIASNVSTDNGGTQSIHLFPENFLIFWRQLGVERIVTLFRQKINLKFLYR